MAQASELVLDGFRLRTDGDKKIVKYPDRYVVKRGVMMWSRVMMLLKELEQEAPEIATAASVTAMESEPSDCASHKESLND